MNHAPPPEDLPLRPRVAWACKYTRVDESDPPAVVAGQLHQLGVLDTLDIDTIAETLEARR